MEYILSLTEQSLCNQISKTQRDLFICMPLIQPKVIKAVKDLHECRGNNVSINLGIDFTPETFRQGYGEFDSYKEDWIKKFNVRQIQDNRISFIISDDFGYFLFFESRYLIEADKPLINAIKIDPISIVRLKQYFFNAFDKGALANHLANAIIDESLQLKSIEMELQSQDKKSFTIIDSEMVDYVKNDLIKNPPLKPDYKRIVEVYSNKFQYVKLEFKGANLKTKKIELPKRAIPVNDPELKKLLEAKLNLFDEYCCEDFFMKLEKFKSDVQSVRDEFLIKIKTREENILSKSNKKEFENAVESLKEDLKKVVESVDVILQEQINSRKETLKKLLTEFFSKNPEFTIGSRASASDMASRIIFHIKWPKESVLTSAFKITTQYSDITFEDIQNEELINELLSRKLIDKSEKNSLADFWKAMEADSKLIN